MLGTNGIAIPADGDEVATAAGFIDFFVGDVDAALAFQSDNGIVTSTAAQEALLADPSTADGTKRSIETFRELTASGDLATTTYPAGLSTLTTELRRIYQELAFRQTSVDQAVNTFPNCRRESPRMTATIQRPPPRAVAPARSHSISRRENLAGYLFLSPWLLGFVLITGGPVLASLDLSFTDYSVLGSPDWTGTENYEEMLTSDPRFWTSLSVTMTYLLASVPLVQVAALTLAVLMNRGVRGLAVYRAVFYIPSLIGGSVAIAILWTAVFAGDGLLNGLLGAAGIRTDYSWIGTPDTARRRSSYSTSGSSAPR